MCLLIYYDQKQIIINEDNTILKHCYLFVHILWAYDFMNIFELILYIPIQWKKSIRYYLFN